MLRACVRASFGLKKRDVNVGRSGDGLAWRRARKELQEKRLWGTDVARRWNGLVDRLAGGMQDNSAPEAERPVGVAAASTVAGAEGQPAEASTSENATEEGRADNSDVPSYWCRSKKKYVIMFGYSGLGYFGLQTQPDVKTIEDDMEAAIAKAGVIRMENQGQLQKIDWSRAARTDKGVHAFGQVIALKMELDESEDQIELFRRRLNELLPNQIRVFDVVRCTKSFNSRNQCDSRRYEYLLPTFLLAPISVCLEVAETLGAAGPASALAESEVDKAAVSADKGAENDKGGANESAPANSKEVYHAYREAVSNKFKAGADDVDRLRAAMSRYLGSQSFHNFSPRVSSSDASAKRYIKEVSVDDPFEVNGLQIVRINIHGQSFMLNQIRKMVAVAVEVVRRGLPVETVDLHFQPERRPTPMIPGQGLTLRACVYQSYNQIYAIDTDCGNKVFNADQKRYKSIDFDRSDISAEREQFSQTVLYPAMVSPEFELAVFSEWIWRQNMMPFPNEVLTGGPDLAKHAATKKRKKEAYNRLRPGKRQAQGLGENVLNIDNEIRQFLNAEVDHRQSKDVDDVRGTSA